MPRRRIAGAGVAILLSAAAAGLVGYLAFAVASLDSFVNDSLPCEPSVILDTDPIIDPAGYSGFSDAQVEASKAYDACLSESLDLLSSQGLTGRGDVVTWLLIVPTDILAAFLIATGWAIAIAGGSRRSVVLAPAVLTVGSLGAMSFQLRYANTIELVGWLTN